MAAKSSAIADDPIEVLFALHPKFDLMDLAGPLEVLTTALHEANDYYSKAFECTLAAAEPKVLSTQGVIVGAQITFKEAHENLNDYDILVILGGSSDELVKASPDSAEPHRLIKAFTAAQVEDTTRERTLLSICTGSLLLAKLGVLTGLSATTHPDKMTAFENLCSEAAVHNLDERTDVIEDARYVVNNLRFEIGDEDDNPYIRRKSDGGHRPSTVRKGSMSFKGSGRRESIVRRAAMRLGGLRVITTRGISAGIDAALYIVSAMVSDESATEVARRMEWTWTKGVVVDGLDV